MIAAVWALPNPPGCDSLAWREDPAIARIDSRCILLSHYADWLYVIETTMQRKEQGLIPEHPDSEYQRRWHDRVNFYGPETIALADSIRDATLFQRAVAGGHAPSQEELSTRLDQDRLRRESLRDIIQLVKLAQNHDLAGFRKLAEETRNPDITGALDDLTSVELMEAMKEDDWRHLEQMQKEGGAYIESFGHELYWQKILPAKLRREMAIGKLKEAVLEASSEGPYAEVPRLAWLAYRQKALEEVSIELTRAAPPTVSVARALVYLSEVLQEEQDELNEEYDRWLERR